MKHPLVLLSLTLFATTPSLLGRVVVAPPEDPPAASVEVQGDHAAAPFDLRSIARREAEREAAALTARVRELLDDLRSSTDLKHVLIRQRIDELSRIGMPALEGLVAAMNHDEGASSAMNAGVNASRALAAIPGVAVSDALTGLTRDGTRFGRRNAARALGLRGDPNALPVLIELLSAEDADVRLEAIHALGQLGHDGARAALVPFVSHAEEATAALAIESLGKLQGDASVAVVLDRLKAASQPETAATSGTVIEAGLDYFTAHPTIDGLEIARELLASETAAVRIRQAAIRTLEAIARKNPRTTKPVLQSLSAATKVGLRAIVKSAALAMLALGDDSGVDAVTADYDFDIQKNPKNFNSRYKRADVYLEFRRWKSAYQDIQYGLKVEKEPRDPERIYFALARASAGQRRYGDAAKYLRRLSTQQFSHLPTEYPEFAEMAEDSRYSSLFAPQD